MTDASAWRRTGGNGVMAGAPGSPNGRTAATESNAWWSEALSDPWRDPRSPAFVVMTSPPSGPELEPAAEPEPPSGRGGTSLRTMLVVACLAALFAGAIGGTLGYVFAVRAGTIAGTQLGAGKTAPLAERPPQSIAALAKRVLPSVVTLRIRSGDAAALGSGFVVTADGYIVTNNHVVEGGNGAIQVTFSDSSTADATLVGADPESDLAIVKVNRGGLTPVEFGDSDTLQVGDPVIAVGAPLALSNTVTYGIVSALDRPIRTVVQGGGSRYYAAIQTDAAVNQGNSGGPLFDAAGRVVGVNSVIGSLSEDQEHAGNVGLAFAIPINQTQRVAKDIIDRGSARRTVIGAQLDNAYTAGGARLSSVEPNGPAGAAGLRAGDVIFKIGAGVVNESWDVIALVRRYPPGATVGVEYTRDGARQTVRVTLAADAK